MNKTIIDGVIYYSKIQDPNQIPYLSVDDFFNLRTSFLMATTIGIFVVAQPYNEDEEFIINGKFINQDLDQVKKTDWLQQASSANTRTFFFNLNASMLTLSENLLRKR
jgi:hypothetical protein